MKSETDRQSILIVDDTPENIDVLNGILNQDYRIKAALNGERALKIALSETPPDLILLDIMMPGMDGYEVCNRLKASAATRRIPVIFVSAKGDVADETRGFETGAVDYITKPVSPPIVRARVKTHLELYDQKRVLERQVRRRTREITHTQDVTILGLAVLAEYRDNETGGHIRRTQHYLRILAEHLRSHPKFRDFLDDDTIDLLFKSTPLHDIGKVGVPDAILLKPGNLTDEEFEIMKKHTIYGRDAIIKAEEALESRYEPSFLKMAREMAHTHHERWDGSGYPEGLVGEEIPIAGRLMALADIYDALISKRIYKAPFSHGEAVRIITKGDGRVEPTHFDPDVLEAFRCTSEAFREVALAYADHDDERRGLAG